MPKTFLHTTTTAVQWNEPKKITCYTRRYISCIHPSRGNKNHEHERVKTFMTHSCLYQVIHRSPLKIQIVHPSSKNVYSWRPGEYIILAGKLTAGQLVAVAIEHYFGGKLPGDQQLARSKRKSCRNHSDRRAKHKISI